ncbi:MAG: MotA/TolQ/ExbB proton channel family protein, partial [Treponemataceae bacterium]
MFEVIKSGGLLMIPIFLCAIIATFIVFERLFYFKINKRKNDFLFENIDVPIKNREFDQAIDLCNSAQTPTAQLIKKALLFRNYPNADIREAVENEGKRLLPALERFVSPLGTIAHISTLLGLLGTVLGNIQAFGVLGSTGTMANPALLASSIAQALITTAAGLFVSSPSLIFYNHLVSKMNTEILTMEAAVNEIIIRL